MNISDFEKIYARARVERPKIFQLSIPDAVCTDFDVYHVESSLGLLIPQDVKSFWKTFGAGSIGLIDILSPHENSAFSIIKYVQDRRHLLPSDWLPFSDDLAGGVYMIGLPSSIEEGSVAYFDYGTSAIEKSDYDNVYQLVAKLGFD
jgi:hypothetical protein